MQVPSITGANSNPYRLPILNSIESKPVSKVLPKSSNSGEISEPLLKLFTVLFGSTFITSGLIAMKTATPAGRLIGALHMGFGALFAKMAINSSPEEKITTYSESKIPTYSQAA